MADIQLNLAQAAELLDVNEITVKRYVREHLIKSEEVEGNVLFNKEDLERYKEITTRMGR